MKAKITVEMELYIPNELSDKPDNDVVQFIDQSLRDQLYVGTVYSTEDPWPYAQPAEITIRSYFNLDRKYNDTDYNLCQR